MDPPRAASEYNYDGSRTFEWLANLCGLSVDLVNFLLAQCLALFLASLFRSILHPSKVSTEVRHVFGLILGLFFGYFCFGQQAIHIAGLPAVCYIVIRTQNPMIVQRAVMIAALIYLSLIHLHRQIYDYGSYALDITGPLMIITQKVTSLAFSIHDGFTREQEDLTKAQQYHAVQKLPSALEYFSYLLHFQSLMAGPMVFYKDYIEFIEGYNILKHANANNNFDSRLNAKEIVLEPSPTKAVVKKFIGSLVCAFIFIKFITVYPIKTLKDENFTNESNTIYKFWFIIMATTVIRFKYYHAWLLADAICNNSGLGFNGYDKLDGSPKWDLISNINVLPFEFGTNFRDSINHWNIGTNRWLRCCVYERVPKQYGTILTFSLSALWHGFYPGYYVTFATGALIVMAARMGRRLFRHRFQKTQHTRMFYDILTCLITRIFMGYATFPFVLLELKASLRLYLNIYMCLHLVAILTIFILPKFIRGESSSTAKKPTNGVILQKSTDNNVDHCNENNENGNLLHPTSSPIQISAGKENNCDTTTNTREITQQIPQNGNSHQPQHYYYSADSLFQPNGGNFGNSLEELKISTEKRNPVPFLVTSASEAVSVKHDECEMDSLSNRLKQKIDLETRNIEEFIDKTVTKTVTGIVELKDDLMRMNDTDKLFITNDGNGRLLLRKRHQSNKNNLTNGEKKILDRSSSMNGADNFLKKEIDALNAAVQQANVLPAVLSNGHAK